MDSKKVIEVQNSFGRFIQLFNLNHICKCAPLFTENARLWLPDYNIECHGLTEIRKALSQIEYKRNSQNGFVNLHIPHTAAYQTDENGLSAKGTWDLFSYVFSDETGCQMEYVYSRIDAEFVMEDTQMKIRNLDWWEVGSFEPRSYSKEERSLICKKDNSLPEPPAFHGITTASDFYKIQNICSRFVLSNRKYAMEDTFSHNEDIFMHLEPIMKKPARNRLEVIRELENLRQLEEENKGNYLYVPLCSAPVIELEENNSKAKAQWMALILSVKGPAYGIMESPYLLSRSIGLITSEFIKENGKWKMQRIDTGILRTLPEFEIKVVPSEDGIGMGFDYQRMAISEDKWKMPLPKLSGDYPDDLPEVESQIAYWVNAYRRGEHSQYVLDYMKNEDEEVSFRTKSSTRNSAPTVGTKALMERLGMGVAQYHHQQITCHSLLSPDVEITEDGRYATLTGYDICTTAYLPGRNGNPITLDIPEDWDSDHSPIERVPCLYNLSRYDLKLVKTRGTWKHYCTEWEVLIHFPDIYLAGKNSRGWSGAVTDIKYPGLWEKYFYKRERKNGKPADQEKRMF